MATRTGAVRLDSCDCVVEYEYDDTTSEDTRTHTIIDCRRCAIHSQVPIPPGAIFESDTFAPVEQNHRKVKVLSAALNLFTEIRDGVEGNFTLKNGVEVLWAWNGLGADRVLFVSFAGVTLTTQRKNQLQNRADQLFGTGKVVVS